MDSTKKALATNNSFMLFYGISAILIGPTLPSMIVDFNLTLSQAGLISSLQNAGGLAGAFAAMLLADRLPRSFSILISFALLSLTLIAVGSAGTYAMLLITLAASGFFIRVLDVMLNAHTGTLLRGKSGRGMNILHMYFSIGAFLGPLVARLLLSSGIGWNGVYRLTGAGYLCLLLVGSWWLRDFSRRDGGDFRPMEEEQHATAGRAGNMRVLPVVVIIGLVLFFYAVHQMGLSSWLPQYLESVRNANPDLAGIGLSLYWVGIIFGRLITAQFADRLNIGLLLAFGCLLSAIFSAAGVLIPAVPVAVICFGLAGLMSGATIPLAYDFGYRLLPARMGAVTAFLAILMLFGRVAGPWLIGVTADTASLAAAMLIPALALALAFLLALLAVFKTAPAP